MTTTALALLFASASASFNLPQGLLSGLCWVESNHKVDAIHRYDGRKLRPGHIPAASRGICQIKLGVARSLGFVGTGRDLMDPQANIYYAAKLLKLHLEDNDGDLEMAIAAYNMGHCKFDKRECILNRVYVDKVLKAWREHR